MYKQRLRRITEEPPRVDLLSITAPARKLQEKLLENIPAQTHPTSADQNVLVATKDNLSSSTLGQVSREALQSKTCQPMPERMADIPSVKRAKEQKHDSTITTTQLTKREEENPPIPKRTTSMTRPATRRRHRDLVAFHRHSCQIFSSLDGTLEQARMSVSSSSSSSSSSSASYSSSLSSPVTGCSSRNASIDYSVSSPLMGSTITRTDHGRAISTAPPSRRPTLQRMQCVKSPSSTVTAVPDLPQISSSSISTSKSIPQPNSRSQPPITTTPAYFSSQTILPISSSTVLDASRHNPTTKTTIHWTSPESRRREYAKIDAANSGFRLLLRRVFPRVVCRKVGGGRAAFWNDRTRNYDIDAVDDDDAKSVRRFRVECHDNYYEPNNEIYDEKKSIAIEETEVNAEPDEDSKVVQTDGNTQTSSEKGVNSRTGTDLSTISYSSSRPVLPSFQSTRRESKQKPQRFAFRRMLGCCI